MELLSLPAEIRASIIRFHIQDVCGRKRFVIHHTTNLPRDTLPILSSSKQLSQEAFHIFLEEFCPALHIDITAQHWKIPPYSEFELIAKFRSPTIVLSLNSPYPCFQQEGHLQIIFGGIAKVLEGANLRDERPCHLSCDIRAVGAISTLSLQGRHGLFEELVVMIRNCTDIFSRVPNLTLGIELRGRIGDTQFERYLSFSRSEVFHNRNLSETREIACSGTTAEPLAVNMQRVLQAQVPWNLCSRHDIKWDSISNSNLEPLTLIGAVCQALDRAEAKDGTERNPVCPDSEQTTIGCNGQVRMMKWQPFFLRVFSDPPPENACQATWATGCVQLMYNTSYRVGRVEYGEHVLLSEQVLSRKDISNTFKTLRTGSVSEMCEGLRKIRHLKATDESSEWADLEATRTRADIWATKMD